MARKILIPILLLCLALTGCVAATPDPQPLDEVPEAWSVAQDSTTQIDPLWWRRFGSAQLEQLVACALENSPDLATTAEKVVQAELGLRSAGASLFPALTLGGSASRKKSYYDGESQGTTDATALSLGVSYEIDLWGKLASQKRSAAASYQAAQYDYDAARLSLIAGVAQGYFEYLCLQERLQFAEDNLSIAERILKIVESRWNNGSVTELDLVQQQSAVLSQRSNVLALEEQLQQTRNALAVLTGLMPQKFALQKEQFSALQAPPIAAGLPSELLLRRPDLAAAEANLTAAAADVKAARAELFPSLSLTGSAGAASTVFFSLADPTTSLALAGSLAQTLFDGGERKNQIRISESQQRALVETYRQTVLTAFQEVEDALVTEQYAGKKADIQSQTVAKARKTLELSEVQYKYGAEDMNTVLSAQQSKNQAEDELLQLRLERLNNLVTLYKTLGGGWSQIE